MSGSSTTVTLRALEGEPLEDDAVRSMVLATAEAIAERQGVTVLNRSASTSSVTFTLETGRIEAVGFAAELRRLTTNWYSHKYGKPHLWGEGHHHDDGDAWKGA